jgi:hypothetical protein
MLKVAINAYTYDNGSPYWLVSCTLPTGSRYRKKWDSLDAAEKDKVRVQREHGGQGMTLAGMQEVEVALHRLRTTPAPGQGKPVSFAIDWFLRNYKGEDTDTRTLKALAEVYLARKKLRVQPKTFKEISIYVADFNKAFGHLRPVDVKADEIDRYLSAESCRHARDKVLRAWFLWMTGAARKLAKLESPPLQRSQFDFIERAPVPTKKQTVILYVDEVRRLIREAIKQDAAGWIVWSLFTGMRPEAESAQFWKLEGHGWAKVDLHRRVIVVTDEIEKTGKRNREIMIQPNLLEWIAYFQKHGTKMTFSRRKFRAVKLAAVPSKSSVQDILRHTTISNLVKITPSITEVCYQMATSQRMILKHYMAAITDQKAVEEFWSLTPKSFGLV